MLFSNELFVVFLSFTFPQKGIERDTQSREKCSPSQRRPMKPRGSKPCKPVFPTFPIPT